MSESKQRARSESVGKWIEASEQERTAILWFFSNFVRPKGGDQASHRRLFKNFALRAMSRMIDESEAKAEAEAEEKNRAAKPTRIAQFSAELVEYETSADVIEYFVKTTENGEVPGGWIDYIGEVRDRMQDKQYKAPSVQDAEAQSKAAVKTIEAPAAEDATP
jgi:hypothetical protein